MINLIRIILTIVFSACINNIFSTASHCSQNVEFSADSSKQQINYDLYAHNDDSQQGDTNESQNGPVTNKSDKRDDRSNTDKTSDLSQVINGSYSPTQYCMGKYKKLGDTGYEIITVKCPEVTDKCTCEIDIKNFTEFVDCGGIRKSASKGSEIKECNSLITGN